MWYCLAGSESSSDLSDLQENATQAEDQASIALHKYVDGPEMLTIDPWKPPVVLPKKGFRVELGGSLPEKDILPNVKLERQEKNSLYFREHFFGKKHANYVGGDRNKPVVVSITLDNPVNGCNRAIVRTKQDDYFLLVHDSFFRIRMMRSLVHSLPSVLANVKLKEVRDDSLNRKLLHMEDRLLVKSYKFGVLYCKEGQTNEDDMFGNCNESEQFKQFLSLLGDKVPLKGYTGFRGGLDVESDTTGTHAIVTKQHTFEIIYHVSTMLPFSHANSQQVERKRHIGNDVVVVVFQDGPTPFDPTVITSKFNHVYIVVQYDPKLCNDGKTRYRIGVASKKGVVSHGPPLPDTAILEHGPSLREYLITKLINAERASYYAPGFLQTLTRRDWLREILDEFGN